MRDARIRLQDILFAIEQIEKYRAHGRTAFDQDELIQVWMVHHLQIIGEATAQLGRNFHETYPYAPWAQIVAMRNILVHQYSGVDLNEIWNAVERDVPALRQTVERLLQMLESNESSEQRGE
ncbi:MAG: DUF86 domain-containing protein [Roseiflexaceae bacterium]|nr:DUF86 domain-containing protein [Roseiflexaceae bacterium]